MGSLYISVGQFCSSLGSLFSGLMVANIIASHLPSLGFNFKCEMGVKEMSSNIPSNPKV